MVQIDYYSTALNQELNFTLVYIIVDMKYDCLILVNYKIMIIKSLQTLIFTSFIMEIYQINDSSYIGIKIPQNLNPTYHNIYNLYIYIYIYIIIYYIEIG